MNIKIITINIEAGRLMDNLVAFVAAHRPDILLLQEVFTSPESPDPRFHVLEALHKTLPHHHLDRAATYDTVRDGVRVEAGNAILSKFPFVDRSVVFYGIRYASHYVELIDDFSTVPRNLQHVQLDGRGTTLHVFNTHGIWGIDPSLTTARLHMSQVIVEQIRGRAPVVLGGDFNTVADTPPIDMLEQHLTNVFKGKIQSTLNMRRKRHPVYATLALDMLFVSKDVAITQAECPEVNISDHLPLIMEMML